MIIDSIKKIILRFLGNNSKFQDYNITQIKSEIKEKEHEVSERYNNIIEPHDVSINIIDDDLMDERIPCVYGPPSWYKDNGSFDINNPEAKHHSNEAEEIRQKNRLRKELRTRLQNSIDKPIPKTYGPDPRIKL